jgi:peptidoglycan hydrolase CwlO-like protein
MAKIGNMLKKSKISFQSVLNNRFLLYFVLVLAATDLYVFAVNGELGFVALFVIIGFLTTFFSKNMTVILFVAVILTNILRFGKDVTMKEGMADGIESEPKLKEAVDGDQNGDNEEYLDGKEKSTKKPKKDLDTEDAKTTTKDVSPTDITTKIDGLDKDTAELMEKQKKLLENMENLNPLLQRAEQFLERFKTGAGKP